MDYKFKKEDIGKRVLLLIDLEKISEDSFFNEEGKGYGKIPYESIINYQFLFRVQENKPQTKVIDIGKTERKINPYFFKSFGANRMSGLGDIIEISEDYLKIKKLSNFESSKLIKNFYTKI